jgi:hypothetical protein
LNVFDAFRGRLVLVDSAFGLEYPRPLPPLIHMVGPMVVPETLSDSDRAWLESDPRPVVFVSFGTIAPITAHHAAQLVEGLRSESFRVLFKLDKSMHSLLPPVLPPNVRVESWVSSQLAHLAHPKVKVFISHCGINSAHESVYFQTALLCIPMFGDQLDMGYRVANAGVGKWLDKMSFTSAQIQSSLVDLLEDRDGSVARSLSKQSHLLQISGGARRAADLIEHAALHGTQHLATADVDYPWYSFYKLDVYLVWSLLIATLLLLTSACSRCCGRCCCRRGSSSLKASTTSSPVGKKVTTTPNSTGNGVNISFSGHSTTTPTNNGSQSNGNGRAHLD